MSVLAGVLLIAAVVAANVALDRWAGTRRRYGYHR